MLKKTQRLAKASRMFTPEVYSPINHRDELRSSDLISFLDKARGQWARKS
jgi:hypothetical protein